jgi:hypothetical protein
MQLTGFNHCSEGVSDVNELLKALVERHNSTAAPHGFECVTTRATTHIENQISRFCSQPVVVNREH